jgi:catechol 2,3-dioxygenase-like lactoylglutathione lyase family enzyme
MNPSDDTAESPALVPELLVTELSTTLDFWVTLCGFTVRYDRPKEGFAYLTLGAAHVMLEQIGVDRNWIPDVLQRPLGRGVNFEITVPSIAPLVERLGSADWPLFMAPEYKTYFTGETAVSVAQFLVQDPDGYLLRFASPPT